MLSFIKSFFCEDDGTGSASRLLMVLHSVFGCVWGSHVVYHSHALPDPVSMAGITAFVTAPYAVNKMHSAVTAFIPGSNSKAGD